VTAPAPRAGGFPAGVLAAGLTAGTALLVTFCLDGWRPRIGGLPPLAGLAAGYLAAWLTLVTATSLAAGLLARHRKALARHAARGAGKASLAAARGAGTAGRAATTWLAAKAGPRWQARAYQPLLLSRPGTSGAGVTGGTPGGSVPSGGDAAPRVGEAAAGPASAHGLAAARAAVTRLTEVDRHMTSPITTTAGMTMPAAAGRSGPARQPAPGRAARGSLPGPWAALAAATADFEPDDDADMLEWMAAQVTGMAAYAEALADVYETCVNSLGVDPAAMNAVHDTADAAADAATAMAYARQKFAAHYAEVREFAAAGGLLPFNGRWITGDGDT